MIELISLLVLMFIFYVVFSPLFRIAKSEAKVETVLRDEIEKNYEEEVFVYDDDKTYEENFKIKDEIFLRNFSKKEELLNGSKPELSESAKFYLWFWLPLAILGLVAMFEDN